MRLTRMFPITLAALAFSTPVHAQQGAVEFGIDAGLLVNINDNTDNLTTVCIPCQRFRVGFFVSDQFAFEPAIALNVLSGGGETLTTFSGSASLLYHFTADPDRARVFFSAGAGFSLIDVSDLGSVNQFGVNGGIGVKAPVGNQLAFRLEGVAGYSFENDDVVSSFNIGALVGLSFLTR